MSTVLVPLPDRVVFASERGDVQPECAPLLLTGVLFGQLGAEPARRRLA